MRARMREARKFLHPCWETREWICWVLRHRWADRIEIDHEDRGREGVDCTYLTENTGKW